MINLSLSQEKDLTLEETESFIVMLISLFSIKLHSQDKGMHHPLGDKSLFEESPSGVYSGVVGQIEVQV